MTISIRKTYKFEAAHYLPGHNGKCSNLHGHSYVLEVELTGTLVSRTDASDFLMVTDFHDLDSIVKPLIETRLDHKDLNETLKEFIPRTTAEGMVIFIAAHIKALLPEHLSLTEVVVWETATSRAIWRGQVCDTWHNHTQPVSTLPETESNG